MKSILFSILFLLVPKLAISQITENDKIIYLDSIWKKSNNENHQYYRVIKDSKLKKESYIVNDYYKSNVLYMKGTSSSDDKLVKEGEFIFYYENGNKKSVSNFTKNIQNGNEFKWYENGIKKEDGEYILDKNTNQSEYKINQYWDINGLQKVIDGNGDYEEKEKQYFGSGKIKDGFKDGIWQGWVRNPENKYTETYEKGKLISGITVDKNNKKSYYTVLEKKPEPKNGMADFYKFISQNYKLPTQMPKGMSGKIYIEFIVDKSGEITYTKIIRDLGYGTGQEAIRVLKDYNGFAPAEQRGQKVRCSYTLPIAIKGPK